MKKPQTKTNASWRRFGSTQKLTEATQRAILESEIQAKLRDGEYSDLREMQETEERLRLLREEVELLESQKLDAESGFDRSNFESEARELLLRQQAEERANALLNGRDVEDQRRNPRLEAEKLLMEQRDKDKQMQMLRARLSQLGQTQGPQSRNGQDPLETYRRAMQANNNNRQGTSGRVVSGNSNQNADSRWGSMLNGNNNRNAQPSAQSILRSLQGNQTPGWNRGGEAATTNRWGMPANSLSTQSKRPSPKYSAAKMDDFIVVTADTVPGFTVTRLLGDVWGTALREIPTHNLTPAEEELARRSAHEDRRHAVSEMIENALHRGANAVFGLRFESSAPVTPNKAEIVSYGTAAIVSPSNSPIQRQQPPLISPSASRGGGSNSSMNSALLQALQQTRSNAASRQTGKGSETPGLSNYHGLNGASSGLGGGLGGLGGRGGSQNLLSQLSNAAAGANRRTNSTSALTSRSQSQSRLGGLHGLGSSTGLGGRTNQLENDLAGLQDRLLKERARQLASQGGGGRGGPPAMYNGIDLSNLHDSLDNNDGYGGGEDYGEEEEYQEDYANYDEEMDQLAHDDHQNLPNMATRGRAGSMSGAASGALGNILRGSKSGDLRAKSPGRPGLPSANSWSSNGAASKVMNTPGKISEKGKSSSTPWGTTPRAPTDNWGGDGGDGDESGWNNNGNLPEENDGGWGGKNDNSNPNDGSWGANGPTTWG
ncbi:hypothetical protein BT69DRAFT_531952 [Atractiella rhizophila]|nr:hypothetical protein BT69DRAFT_531952 [Atractiella rhizophila]